MVWHEITLSPLDPLLFSDSRSTRPGMDHQFEYQDPSPLTLHGAVVQYFLDLNDKKWDEKVLGKKLSTIADKNEGTASLAGYALQGPDGKIWFPKPLCLRLKSSPINPAAKYIHDLLTPVPRDTEPMASSIDLKMKTHLLKTEPIRDGGYQEDTMDILVSIDLLQKVLTGDVDGDIRHQWIEPKELWRRENRIGLMMNNATNQTVESYLFNRPYRRFKGKVNPGAAYETARFVLWYQTLETTQLKSRTGFCGGDLRRVSVNASESQAPFEDLRQKVTNKAQASKGFFLYLMTPMLVEDSYPKVVNQAPVAAALGKPVYISGWDAMAHQPREMLWLYPAGSIFYYTWPEEISKEKIIKDHWMACLQTSYYHTGLGRVFVGVW